MSEQSIDRSHVVVPLLTIVVGLGIAGALTATPSVSTPAAIAYGVFASTLALLAAVVGLLGWALYTAGVDDPSEGRRVGRFGAA